MTEVSQSTNIHPGKYFDDSSRMKLFYALETFKEMCVCNFAEILEASIAQLHTLFVIQKGVDRLHKDGKEIYCSLTS